MEIIREKEIREITETHEGREYMRVVTEPMVIRCDCGAEIELYDSWATGCDSCPREYNGSGQLLAPREQWGEETGECMADFGHGFENALDGDY